MSRLTVYWESDTSLEPLKGRTLALIGYGNQGRAQALNLRDNGIVPIVGSRPGEAAERAKDDGLEVCAIDEAAARADFVFVLIPDEVAPSVYESEIRPGMREGDLLDFASGYNITYGKIVPPADVDVVMVAPRMIGDKFRERFVAGRGTPSFVAVHQDATGTAKERALAIGRGIGSASGGLFEVSFQEETHLDLYMEQVVWAGLMQWIQDSFDVLVQEGFPAPILALEFFASQEMAEIARAMGDAGFFQQMAFHSHTSQFGTLSRGREMIPGAARQAMLRVLKDEIRSGNFAREWSLEQQRGMHRFRRLQEETERHPIAEGEKALGDLLHPDSTSR